MAYCIDLIGIVTLCVITYIQSRKYIEFNNNQSINQSIYQSIIERNSCQPIIQNCKEIRQSSNVARRFELYQLPFISVSNEEIMVLAVIVLLSSIALFLVFLVITCCTPYRYLSLGTVMTMLFGGWFVIQGKSHTVGSVMYSCTNYHVNDSIH